MEARNRIYPQPTWVGWSGEEGHAALGTGSAMSLGHKYSGGGRSGGWAGVRQVTRVRGDTAFKWGGEGLDRVLRTEATQALGWALDGVKLWSCGPASQSSSPAHQLGKLDP
jgi:hypothetical protein